ncbi:chlorophyll synthesis pathway protein BchC [Elioraea sp. Yellowstone]|jgi:3-hydroxyethyl bacteriochlorophyllide a dehydrogenase|uniref:chlorophyll synthesis pathway protein BchC n=1 Tax=Elioraea sp. Yellowstone TaxID=2592070 RepID=UPI001151733D|nr:chlorophyll synthesis pathway protein BchC [Elioraea sp. Yellowstone]TQF81270.1 chlorophyll synthesis pathway protein BchC [Elioraea sp. Yellowstone]
MDTVAVLMKEPQRLALGRLELAEPGEADVVVDVSWSGISTGTERLLWSGRMPPFPGMGYPLVPGYESVGRIAAAGPASGRSVGETVFVPGSTGFRNARGLFGGAAARLVAPGPRVVPIDAGLGDRGVLIALAATAHHAFPADGPQPDLIVGHGVLGRLMARLAVAAGAAPVVWETNAARRGGAHGYTVRDPAEDTRRDYRLVAEVSGDAAILDALIARLAPGGEIVLAGFYGDRLSFAFPPAFMREARLRVAAEWKPADLAAVGALIAARRLALDGLITHRAPARDAEAAYRTAFTDPACLKMVLDWREVQ